MIRFFAMASAALAFAAGTAHAQQTASAPAKDTTQEERRVCSAPRSETASLSDVNGQVLVSRAGGGFAPAANGATLGAGDRLLVRDNSRTTFRLGPCVLLLTDPSVVTLTQSGDFIIAAAEVETALVPGFVPSVGTIIGGAAVVGGGTIILAHELDNHCKDDHYRCGSGGGGGNRSASALPPGSGAGSPGSP
jgi:hypothetical protein